MGISLIVLPLQNRGQALLAKIVGAPKHQRRQRQRDRCLVKAFEAFCGLSRHHGVSRGGGKRGKGGGGGKGTKGEGKRHDGGFAVRALSWVCKPCEWRNPPATS